ncbi:MAG: hypothetical protein JSS93_00625 [Bacteroidetes bacterium]|nr:hypothetical protein [Bacteroidota bacterium]
MKKAIAVLCLGSSLLCAAQAEEHLISPELVGKWCYISETVSVAEVHGNSCIILQADGTYEATLDRSSLPNGTPFSVAQDTDRGTWWVKDNRLFYNSELNGQGSFFFQKRNHPRNESIALLVVNGLLFATASSHDPW